MARKSMAYDHAAYTTRQVDHLTGPAAAASTAIRKFVAFTDIKVKSIGGNVRTAGTHDAAGYELINGVTSFATLTAGTLTAGASIVAYTGNQTLASGGYINVKTLADSATLAADFYIEYELIPGAEVTV